MEAEKNNQIISKEEQDSHYYCYFFYYNPDDERVFVPRKCKWMGWSINFGNRKGQLLGAGVFAAIGALCAYCYKNDKKMHYSFSELYDAIKSKF